ncbi:hypothetical protein OH77DRAFT_1139428 [Trametes cingulata]|nr:hypothetical protein OH77DRAFT_1139428 [Trametes cingulata]
MPGYQGEPLAGRNVVDDESLAYQAWENTLWAAGETAAWERAKWHRRPPQNETPRWWSSLGGQSRKLRRTQTTCRPIRKRALSTPNVNTFNHVGRGPRRTLEDPCKAPESKPSRDAIETKLGRSHANRLPFPIYQTR